MLTRVCFFLLFVITIDCSRFAARQNASRRDTPRARSLNTRGDVMEHLFNIYDPSFLAVVWPKISNGVHLSVGHFCWEDVSTLFRDLCDGRAWAYNVVDASGRYQGGLFSGSRFWLGSKQQCLKLDNDFLTRETNGSLNEYYEGNYLKEVLQQEKYYGTRGQEWQQLSQRDEVIQRVAAADNRPPHRLAYAAVRVSLNVTKVTMAKSYDITLGVCLPRSCSVDDIESILTFSILINDNLKSNKTIPRMAKVTSLRIIEEFYHLETDTGAVILICLTVFLLVLSVVATIVEFNWIKWRLKPLTSRSVSFNLQKYNSTNTPNRYFDSVTKKHNETAWKDTHLGKLTITKVDEGNDMSLVQAGAKAYEGPPTVTLDVMSMERATGSCIRCGKYKRQCSAPAPAPVDSTAACPRLKYSSVSSGSTHENRNSLPKRLLLCYSLAYSWRRIFNTNMANKDLSVIHLLRIVATLWVMYVHVAVMVNYIADDAGNINEHNHIFYVLTTGTLAFDTLLFVSGLFSSHHFFYLKSHYTVEELVSFGGICGQIMQFLCFITNRIIRLLPSYAFAILVSGVVARATRDTAAVALPDGDAHNCDTYWWRNLLYLTNIYPAEERCMRVSWYLSAESQLHAMGALACAARAGARGGLVVALAVGFLLAATAVDVSSAYSDYGQYLPGVFEAYSLIIDRTCARAVPYFIGVLTGWMVHKSNGKIHVSKTTATCLWFASAVTIVTSSVVPWLATDWLSAWLHLTWPIALLWPALICATNFASAARRAAGVGGAAAAAAASRLSYGMLLLHGPAARALLLAAGAALGAQPAAVWSYFAGTTLLTLVGALLLSLLVEMPCCSILRRISDCASV